MIIYTDGLVEVKTGTPTPPTLGSAVPAIIYGNSVEVRPATSNLGVLQPTPTGALCFENWHNNAGTYQRRQNLKVLTTNAEAIKFHYFNAATQLPIGTYRLKIGTQVVATLQLTTPTLQATIIANALVMPSGWQQFQIEGPNGLKSIAHWMHVGNLPVDSVIPVEAGSRDIADGAPYVWAQMPIENNPPIIPLAPRDCPSFSTADSYTTMYRRNVIPQRSGNVFRPNINQTGIHSTMSVNPYLYDAIRTRFPKLALLEGPRGFASVPQATHIQTDRHGAPYLATSHGTWRVGLDGTAKIRCGDYHDGTPGNFLVTPSDLELRYNNAVAAKQWETAADLHEEWRFKTNLKLKGKWEQVPRFLRGFQEIWGFAFWQRSLALDPNAPPIGGEQPHLNGPQQFVASPGTNTVYRLTFSKNNTEEEPTVTVFAGDLAHCFDCVEVNDVVYVSERDANRISMWNAANGNFIGILISTSSPEGLFFQDGFLYFTTRSGNQASIRKINLSAEILEVVYSFTYNTVGDQFIKIALSDGTFGPRGTIFYTTYTNVTTGYPKAILPNGTQWTFATHGGLPGGKGGRWPMNGYNCAVGVGMGRLYCSSSDEGLVVISKALPGDPTLNEGLAYQGYQEYVRAGMKLVWGQNTWAHHQIPLPVPTSSAMAYYFQHARL